MSINTFVNSRSVAHSSLQGENHEELTNRRELVGTRTPGEYRETSTHSTATGSEYLGVMQPVDEIDANPHLSPDIGGRERTHLLLAANTTFCCPSAVETTGLLHPVAVSSDRCGILPAVNGGASHKTGLAGLGDLRVASDEVRATPRGRYLSLGRRRRRIRP